MNAKATKAEILAELKKSEVAAGRLAKKVADLKAENDELSALLTESKARADRLTAKVKKLKKR